MHSEKRLDDSGDKSQPAGRLEGADALIAQGSRELRALKLQAEAAKAEAERAELEAILGDARAGNTAALAAWLASRTEEPADLAAHPESGHKTGSQLEQPATSTSQNTSQSTSKRHAQTGWDSPRGSRLQAAARARLIELTQSNAAQSNPAQSQAADSQSIQPQGINSRPSGEATPDLAAKAQNTSSSRETAKKVTPNPSKDAKAGAQSGAEKKALSQPEHRTAASVAVLEAVAKALENHDSDESPRGRRWVGPVVSLVAHVLLLVVLGLVVLKVPSDSAGVALQSASADRIEQVVEVVEQNDVEAPEETEVAEPANVVATAADSLTSVNISDSLATSSLDPGPLASEQLSAAAASASTMSGTGNAASFFGAAVGGNNFCYVIDASGSMRGGPWEAAKFELLKSLASLQSGQRYYVIFFNRKLSPMVLDGTEPASTFVYATPENLAKTRRWIETVDIGIGAPPNNALEFAIELEPDAVYLLTDGVTKVDVAAHLQEINRTESLFGEPRVLTPIHPIAYYSLEGQQLLRRIAAENNGKFIYVPDPRR